jgi:hypothetical protein
MDPSQFAQVIQTISSRLATTIGLTEYLTDDLKHQTLENVINHLIVQRILITPLQIVQATHFMDRLLTKQQQRQQLLGNDFLQHYRFEENGSFSRHLHCNHQLNMHSPGLTWSSNPNKHRQTSDNQCNHHHLSQ